MMWTCVECGHVYDAGNETAVEPCPACARRGAVAAADVQTSALRGQDPLTANEAKLLFRIQNLELRLDALERRNTKGTDREIGGRSDEP